MAEKVALIFFLLEWLSKVVLPREQSKILNIHGWSDVGCYWIGIDKCMHTVDFIFLVSWLVLVGIVSITLKGVLGNPYC